MPTVFHTGFMKTGSTYLQKHVFPVLDECDLHTYGPGRTFVPLMQSVRDRCAPPEGEAIDELRGLAGSRRLQLFSWEGLVGNYRNDHAEFERLSRLIHKAFPDAHILLMIRRQPDLIESLYKQALQTGHSISVEEFVNWHDGTFAPFCPDRLVNLDIARFNFDAFVGGYQAIFPPGHVHVLPYELMRADRSGFALRLSETLGTKVTLPPDGASANIGYNRRTAAIARHINRLYRTSHSTGGIIPYRPFDVWLRSHPRRTLMRRFVAAANAACDPRTLLQSKPVQRLPGEGRVLDQTVRNAITAQHAASNRALDQRLDLGLGELGYY